MDHRFYAIGDCHGEFARLTYPKFPYNKDLKEGDFLFPCGDFGYIWDDSEKERQFLDYLAEEKSYTICFVDGNHENFDLINSYPVEIWNGGKVHIIRRNKAGVPKIIHLMRGQVFNIYGKKIFTFGGAYSIDKKMRTPGVSWWPQEMPSDREMAEANINLEANNHQVDYILTHTAPEETMSLFYPFHWKERRLNNYLEYVRESTTYERWFFGHLHQDKKCWRKQYLLWYDVVDMETGEVVQEES